MRERRTARSLRAHGILTRDAATGYNRGGKEHGRTRREIVRFNSAKRQALGEAFGDVVAIRGWTVWACAVMPNHAHFCIRAHRDDSVTMWSKLTHASGGVMRGFKSSR